MKALITGGAGFIGSHLVDLLLAKGWEVRVIDNLSNGHYRNISQHEGNPQFSFLESDIVEPFPRHTFTGVDYVFHMAALADIVPSIDDPQKYHRVNVDGTVNVLEASRQAGVKKLIYSASSSCYGIPDTYPTPEDAEIRPRYPYAFTKYISEQYVLHWHEIYKLPVISLRYFNVYGPRVRTNGTYGAVFGVFLAQKAAGLPFTVVGDGSQTRDFTYVTDIARANLMAALSSVNGEIINLGSGHTYSVNELVRLLDGPVTYVPKRPGEPDCTFADIAKARRLLGWKAEVSFADGVRAMLADLNAWREAPIWTPEKIAVATKNWFRYLTPDEEENSRAGV